jgi:predicted TIM-barrel fold metal-dependent hydrolase
MSYVSSEAGKSTIARFSRHHPRMRVIQYSRDADHLVERARHTGYPACAGYDGHWVGWISAPQTLALQGGRRHIGSAALPPTTKNGVQGKRMTATRIDCDIHPAVGGTRTTLLPYLDDHWKEQVVSRAIDGLDLTSYPPNMPLSGRSDWRPANGKPGSDLAMVQRGAFDQLGASHAICNVLYGAQAVYDPYMASAFCKAINDWIAAEWLARDTRLRASIVVPMQAPDLAVDEIERRAGDNRFVSVLVLAQGESLLGRRHYWPVYQAAEKHKLPIAVHAGSQYRQAPSSIGWPSYRYEYYLAEAQAFQAQVLSLIYEGVFVKFPRLKVVLMESGVSWLPAFMWRANKTWRGVRVEVPWIDREPASIMRDHIRLTTQPFDSPPDAAGVADIIDMIGSDKMFLFASDYPHWQFDGDDAIPPHLPANIVSRMCADNPLETFPRLSLAA